MLVAPSAALAEPAAARRGPVLVLVSEERGAPGWWSGAEQPDAAEQALADALSAEDVDVVKPPAGAAGGSGEPQARALAAAERLGARFVVLGQAAARDAGTVRPVGRRAATGRYAVRVLAVAGRRPVAVANGTRHGFGADASAARADALREAAAAVASVIRGRLPAPRAREPASQAPDGLAVHLRGATTFAAVEAVEALCRRWSAAASVVELGPGEVVLSLPGGADAAGLAEAARMLPVAGHVVAAAVEGGAVVVRLEPLPDEPPEGERAAPPADPEDLSSEVR